jgi:hypothetical protein
MSESMAAEFETLLKRALAPVEPPADLRQRMEEALTNLTALAAEELEGWEIGAMRDPRNWARPVAAAAVGGAAGAALVVLRVRSGRHKRRAASTGALDLARATARAVSEEARKLLDG